MYVDARNINGKIWVSERTKHGHRKVHSHLPPYTFYYEEPKGQFTSIDGTKLKKRRFTKWREYKNELDYVKGQLGKKTYESDINVVYRFLEERYPEDDTPPLNVSFFDIEVDKEKGKDFARPNNPYAPINAITIYNKWEDEFFTLILKPPTMTMEEARELLDNPSDEDDFGAMTEDDGYYIVETERELLEYTLQIIEGADVLSGWNSKFYDIPYLIERIRIVFGMESMIDLIQEDGSREKPMSPSEKSEPYLKRLSVFPTLPRIRMAENYGKMEKTYELYGRIGLDYQDLYKKFTFEELHSYNLNFVLEKEIEESKVPYEGTLDKLWRYDFRTFVAYNRQDVAGLNRLDDKMKLVELANTMAHSAGVTLDKTLGSVAIIEQAVLRQLHRNGLICFDKTEKHKTGSVAGAYVVQPKAGLYDWIASFDINSLYPSVIRTINISPEVIVGQFRLDRTDQEFMKWFDHYGGTKPGATKKVMQDAASHSWRHFTGVLEFHMVADGTDDELTLVLEEDGEEITATAKEWRQLLKENNWSISGNGTVFDLSREGIISECMTLWYSDRKKFQRKENAAAKAQDALKEQGDYDKAEMKRLQEEETYNKMLQQVKKIFLNSTYGAYLNEAFRFYDQRLGRSVTFTGRCITKHMIGEASYIMTGNREPDERAIIYGDTDSVYCTMKWYMEENNIPLNKTHAIPLADDFGKRINASFPEFMHKNNLVSLERGAIIAAGREVVGRKGLFKDKKKRYAIHVLHNGKKNVDKLKIMGMEVVRSDTPKFIQKFLKSCIEAVVQYDKTYDDVSEMVIGFRNEFRKLDPWKRGSPCAVRNLTGKTEEIDRYEELVGEGIIGVPKPKIHFSVVAARNTNNLIRIHNEHDWDSIHDGDKVQVLVLRDNPYEVKSVAIPTDAVYIPDWFKELPFDNHTHEQKLIDKKLDNVLGSIMGWSFAERTDYGEEVFIQDEDFM